MALAAGDKLGPYEILSLVGKGGMGEVYRAHDPRTGRDVAIKISAERFSQRFDREVRAVASLNHPNICTLYDVGPNYLVMEFIEGKPLSGPLPPATALVYANQILDALRTAHEKGVIHRDLKPANILVTARGVKLLDFGLARVESGAPQDDATQTIELTQAGAVMGTPAYMAPEQWEGKQADTRSDIYAFGCVLYEMLTGKRAGRERTPLKTASLETVVAECLANNPADRYQSASEVKTALAGALKTRRPLYAVAAGLAAAVAIAGFFYWRGAHAAPLTDQDVLVVADFENNAGDPVFDTALRQALQFQLEQSPFLKAMDDGQVRQDLELSGHSKDGRITTAFAREVCVREGQKATLEGSISAIGSSFLIALQAVNCQTGSTIAREQAEASSKEKVVEALGNATTAMRAKLGESLGKIQDSDVPYKQPLTTSSLEALQAFYQGDAAWLKNTASQPALSFYERATEIDPNFALAWVLRGMRSGNRDDRKRFIEKGYALIDRVSERERLFITQEYAAANGDQKKSLEFEELLVRTYPRDPIFHVNLAGALSSNGDWARAATELDAAFHAGAKSAATYAVGARVYMALNRPADAKSIVSRAAAAGVDVGRLHALLLQLAYAQGDKSAQEKERQQLAGKPEESLVIYIETFNALALGQPGKAKELAAKLLPSATPGRGAPTAAMFDAIIDGTVPPPVVISGPPFTKFYADGKSFLDQGQGRQAATEFQKLVDAKLLTWGPAYALAQLGLARATAMAGDTPQAKKAYEDLVALWKDAETGFKPLEQARKEYATLK